MKNLIVLLILALAACTTQPVTPTPSESPTPVVSVTPAPTPIPAANTSACMKYSWKNRGTAPRGYLLGMQAVYQRAKARKVFPLGSADTDALTHYSLPNDTKALYTLLTGLGMRESSGQYYEGRDTSAGTETPAETETGLFQVSYNSFNVDPTLKALWDEYKSHPAQCLLSTFQQGLKAKQTTNYGTGMAYEFQKFTKECPAFAAEYAAVMLRKNRRHFGPINRKEAEYKKECEALFQ